MFHRRQQPGNDPRQPRQRLRIQPIVFLPALPDQAHVARMGHDRFVPQLGEQPADPGRMHSGLERDTAAWHPAEPLPQSFRRRAQFLLEHSLASFLEHAVPA
jgi:hypothetical protein